MPTVIDEKLFTSIKQNNIDNMYFLFGQDSYFVGIAVKQIIEKTVPKQFQSFNLNTYVRDKFSYNDVYSSVEALPMMAEKRCVVIQDVDIDKLKKEEFDQLIDIVSFQNESTVLIICDTTNTIEMKSARIKKLVKLIEPIGVVCNFKFKDKPTLKRALCSRAKKENILLDMLVADILVEQSASDYASLINELDKLIAYTKALGEMTIKKEYISQCTTFLVSSTAFDLSKAILNRKYDRAFSLLDELFFQRVEPLSILGALNMCFIDLYRAKCAMSARKSTEEMTVDFAYPANRKFAVKNAYRDVSSFSIEALRRCITALAKADINLKSSKLDNRIILEQMIGNMI